MTERARRSGGRDAFALIDRTTSVLRVRNGGFDNAVLVDADGLPHLRGVHPWQYCDYAALRGDPSDNLHGVRRFGTAAARLLASFGTVEAAWAAADEGPAVRDVVGDLAAEQLSAPADGAEQTSAIAGNTGRCITCRSSCCTSTETGARTTGRSGCPTGVRCWTRSSVPCSPRSAGSRPACVTPAAPLARRSTSCQRR
jgi:hypothetical protein